VNYLFIREGCTVQTQGLELSREDLKDVADGVTEIIRFRGNQFERVIAEEQDGELVGEWIRV
jgi:hypothetical protein